MKINMLEHQKMLIENVSNNEELFQKEILKARQWLDENDYVHLQNWLKLTFTK